MIPLRVHNRTMRPMGMKPLPPISGPSHQSRLHVAGSVLLGFALLLLQGCGLVGRSVELAASLDNLVPHGDRDHFVFRWERMIEGNRISSGIQVEHVAVLGAPGEFEVTLSEDGLASGRVRIRSDGKRMVVLSEDDMSRGIRITYQPPLPYIEVPLFSGQRQSTVSANVTALEDDHALGVLKVTQSQAFEAAPPVQSALGSFTTPVSLRTTRTVEGGGDTIQINNQIVLAPGLGEVRSEASAPQSPLLRRELICAIIGGKTVGDCQQLKQRRRE